MPADQTIKSIINLWATRAELERDIRLVAPTVKISEGRIHKWAERNVIPAEYQYPVILAAKSRGFNVSADLMVRLHASAGQVASDQHENAA